jgi:uncharacterized protein (TIGR02246 family)
MKRSMTLLVVLMGSLALTTGAIADDAADVEATAEDAVAAYNTGDVDAMATYWLPEATIFHGPGLPLEGFDKEQIKADLEAGLKYDFQWRDFSVKVYGQTAVSTASLEGTITLPNGTVLQGPWRHSATWVKQDGKWKVAHVHASELLPEVYAAQRLIARAHQAYTDGDLEAALSCYGDNYLRVFRGEGEVGDPTRWFAGGFATKASLRALLAEDFALDNFSYAVDFEFLHTNAQGTSAVVLTIETGSSTVGERSNTWEDVTNLWSLAKIDGGWRIVGSVHHVGEEGKIETSN